MNIKLLMFFLSFSLMMGCFYTGKNTKNEITTSEQVVKTKATHVITSTTAYYTTSPAQGRPADGRLETGTEVYLVRNAGSYTLVKTSTGISGYVSSAALKPIKK
jgi:hypothetical protein